MNSNRPHTYTPIFTHVDTYKKSLNSYSLISKFSQLSHVRGMKQVEEILITFYRTTSVFKTFKIYSCPPPFLVVLPIEIGDRAVIMTVPLSVSLFLSLSLSQSLSRSLSLSLSKTVTCSMFHIQ